MNETCYVPYTLPSQKECSLMDNYHCFVSGFKCPKEWFFHRVPGDPLPLLRPLLKIWPHQSTRAEKFPVARRAETSAEFIIELLTEFSRVRAGDWPAVLVLVFYWSRWEWLYWRKVCTICPSCVKKRNCPMWELNLFFWSWTRERDWILKHCSAVISVCSWR